MTDLTRTAPVPRALPRHIAIIMDGNGRWAKARGLPRIAGHRSGAEAVRRTVTAAGARLLSVVDQMYKALLDIQ